ncbi:hypothetical protein [Pseudoalteromonas aurantia]|uniref:Flagellar protein FliT n=1 Tax=Pseudoalteromonas aurantia TaxID=43654 RepID=A0ABY2VXK3_9GAMM|nr:hypothetical protein [Pseudoalteromonas aurantia]TMO63257.1 hypothetical protein CWC18_08460 [Pseudoalteromonas aurantia]TMO74426.1 hypothetical protein CWC20_10860 [Pseudoalteromonas aurantia]
MQDNYQYFLLKVKSINELLELDEIDGAIEKADELFEKVCTIKSVSDLTVEETKSLVDFYQMLEATVSQIEIKKRNIIESLRGSNAGQKAINFYKSI